MSEGIAADITAGGKRESADTSSGAVVINGAYTKSHGDVHGKRWDVLDAGYRMLFETATTSKEEALQAVTAKIAGGSLDRTIECRNQQQHRAVDFQTAWEAERHRERQVAAELYPSCFDEIARPEIPMTQQNDRLLRAVAMKRRESTERDAIDRGCGRRTDRWVPLRITARGWRDV